MQNKLKKEWQRPSIISELPLKQTLGGPIKNGKDAANKTKS
ncbi:hypothetical protein [Algibacter mikhailovii]|nr:hypothetical protein [Algibacter mikhailovii]